MTTNRWLSGCRQQGTWTFLLSKETLRGSLGISKYQRVTLFILFRLKSKISLSWQINFYFSWLTLFPDYSFTSFSMHCFYYRSFALTLLLDPETVDQVLICSFVIKYRPCIPCILSVPCIPCIMFVHTAYYTQLSGKFTIHTHTIAPSVPSHIQILHSAQWRFAKFSVGGAHIGPFSSAHRWARVPNS